jgi:hypothetical protein
MFERISGFFKKFSRRRKQQSGETTIMDGKEPGIDEFGLDDDFAGLDTLDETDDTEGLDFGAGPSEPGLTDGLSDLDVESDEIDITTGASDFDEQTISDEVTGGDIGEPQAEPGLDEMFPGEAEGPVYAEAEPEPTSLVKRIIVLVIAFVVAGGVGAAFQIFLWPTVGKMTGLVKEEVKLDVQTEVNSKTRQKTTLQKELKNFRQIGGPDEVKGLQDQLAQIRDTQGSMEEFQKVHEQAKQKETAYNELLTQIEELGKETSNIRGEIAKIKSDIERTRNRVVALAKRSEEEYERFSLELTRAELSQRLLIELQMEDIESLRIQLAELNKALSRLPLDDSETETFGN